MIILAQILSATIRHQLQLLLLIKFDGATLLSSRLQGPQNLQLQKKKISKKASITDTLCECLCPSCDWFEKTNQESGWAYTADCGL